jgi:hypothetical protein
MLPPALRKRVAMLLHLDATPKVCLHGVAPVVVQRRSDVLRTQLHL